jgi:hypothetical protein
MLDLGIDLDVWPWMWLGFGVVFALIELILLPGSFVILPFAVSAFAASIIGFYDFSIEIQWAVFLIGGDGRPHYDGLFFPRDRSASATRTPEASDTSRSEEVPPMNTVIFKGASG